MCMLLFLGYCNDTLYICSALFGNLCNFETALRKLAVAKLRGQFQNCVSLEQFNPLNTKLSCWNFNLVNADQFSRE